MILKSVCHDVETVQLIVVSLLQTVYSLCIGMSAGSKKAQIPTEVKQKREGREKGTDG